MTDIKMPLMLDANDVHGSLDDGMAAPMQVDHLDVDDLFGESVTLGLPNAGTPSRQLSQRIDEVRTRGCCQSIAWSKSGTIASITLEGKSIQVRFLRADPVDGQWGLSEPTTVDLIVSSPSIPIVHLAWANTSSHELAVIDATGRVAILAFSMALNRPFLTRRWDSDHTEDLKAVAGCFWLNLASQHKNYHVSHGPAVKDGASYRYESSFLHAFGPWHPNPQKSALLCVTTHGQLKLFWTQSNNKLEETVLELENIGSSDDLITHASLHSDKNHMYVALATASGQLRAVRVSISWGLPTGDHKLPPGGQTLNPSMQARYLATTSWLPSGPNATGLDSSMTQLSHIELLPSQLDHGGQNWSPINILVIRHYLPSASNPHQDQQTVIDRWELSYENGQNLHPAFEQMGVRRNSNTNATDKEPNRLKKLAPTVINKIVVALHPMHFGKVICIASSDGAVEYRDRFSMHEVYNELNLDRIMCLNQVGFTFSEQHTSCTQVAFSPTNCSIVQVLDDGQVKWDGLRLNQGDVGSTNQDPQYAAIVAALTVVASSSIFYHVNMDDVLAVARPYAEKKTFARDWISEIIRTLKVPMDYSEETHHETLVRNATLQYCLSIGLHLGYRGEYKARSFGGKFAFLSLNVRNVVVLITLASNTPSNMREKLSPLDDHEVVDALCGCTRWSIDLLSWIADSLFTLMDDPEFKDLLNPKRFQEISAYMQARSDPALQLLLCSSTRGFLSALCHRLQHLETLSYKAIDYYERRAAMQNTVDPTNQGKLPHVLLYKAYQKIQHITHNSLVKVQDFEKLLNTFGSDVRAAYQNAFAGLAAQQQLKEGGQANQKAIDAQIKSAQFHSELSMLLTAQPPPPFFPVLKKFFNSDLKAFKGLTDPAKLFFSDYGLLEISDSSKVLDARKAANLHVDVFRRLEMMPPSAVPYGEIDPQIKESHLQWRRCVRCTAVMEDVYGSRPGFTFVLAQQRRCSCGGYWAQLPRGSLLV